MNSNNLTFSSKIDANVEDTCFDILLSYFEDKDYKKVYVTNVVLAPDEILFFAEIEEIKSIVRVPIIND